MLLDRLFRSHATDHKRMSTKLTPRLPGGPTLLALGVFAGLGWPALADAARPLMSATIFIFILGTLLRVDRRELMVAIRSPMVSVVLPSTAMIACPVLIGLGTHLIGLDAELAFAMVLSAAAPPSSGTTAVARMLGLNPTVPFAVTVLAMAIAPFSLPLVAAWFTGVALDPLTLAAGLAMMIGGAGAVALVLRRYQSARLSRHHLLLDRLVLTALLVFAVATMAGVRQQIAEQPMTALACIGLAFGCNIGLQCLGAVTMPGTLPERLTAGLILGNRNVGLVWSAIGAVSPRMALFFAATQFPIYILPRLIDILMRRAKRESVLP